MLWSPDSGCSDSKSGTVLSIGGNGDGGVGRPVAIGRTREGGIIQHLLLAGGGNGVHPLLLILIMLMEGEGSRWWYSLGEEALSHEHYPDSLHQWDSRIHTCPFCYDSRRRWECIRCWWIEHTYHAMVKVYWSTSNRVCMCLCGIWRIRMSNRTPCGKKKEKKKKKDLSPCRCGMQ